MAIKPGQSSQPDEIFGLEGRLGNSPFEAERVGFGVGFMVKVFFCVFYTKRKDTDKRPNQVRRKYDNQSPVTALEMLVGIS